MNTTTKKCTLTALILLLFSVTAFSASYYVSPSGSDSNSGTQGSPFATLTHAISVVSAGDYIYMRGGTYYYSSSIVIDRSKNGSSSAPIRVFAYNGETPIIDFSAQSVSSSNRGIVMDAFYWHWRGITIQKAGDNGMLLSGNNNTIENCIFRQNRDTGLQLSRYNTSANSISQWPSNNLITGCEAFDNADPDSEDADGFAAKLTCGEGNQFINCVSHHNIDDGWDLYTKSDTGPIGVVYFEGCIAHSNGTLTNGSTSGNGDKNGYKLGSSAHNINHILRRCIAFNNGKHGFADNGNTGSMQFINCTSYNNEEYNFHTRDGASHIFRNNLSYQSSSNDRIRGNASAPNAFDNQDSWPYTASSSDFVTLNPGPNHAPTSNGFLNLSSSSSLIDAGVTSSGISYNGSSPDLGAVEYGGTTPPPGNDYSLTTSVQGQGTVSPNGGTYNSGASVTLTATPANGWVFSNWSGAASGSSNPVTITMNSNKSVTAVFTESNTNPPPSGGDEIHNFTASGTSSSFFNISGNLSTSKGTVNYAGLTLTQCLKIETVTSISFTSSQEGTLTLVFNNDFSDNIVIDGNSLSASSGILTTTLSAGSHTISKDDVANLYYMSLAYAGGGNTQYTVSTATNGNGSVSGGGTYAEGTVVSLSAVPNSGYVFNNWSGDVSGSANPLSVTVNGNKSITANFSPDTGGSENVVTLQESQSGFCSVDGTIDNNNSGFTGIGFANTENASGEGINWNISGDAGTYVFRWRYANGSATNRTGVLSINGTPVSTEDFAGTGGWTTWTTTSVTLANQPGGNKSLRLEASQGEGLPNIDYLEVTGPNVSAASCGGGTNYYSLSVSANPSNAGSVSLSPSGGNYAAGTVVTLTASANSGYSFSGWSGDASGNSTSTTVTMDGNKSVTAAFISNNGGGGNANYDLIGWATQAGGTTGGQGGVSVTCATGDCILNAIDQKKDDVITQPLIIYVNGTVTPSNTSASKIDIKEVRDVSIIGVGTSGVFNGIGLKVYRAGNVIIQNVTVHHVDIGDKDAISIEGPADHVWVDHCELYAEYQGVGKDDYDGLLDAKSDAEYITYSYNYLHDSWKTMLVGSSDGDDDDRKITAHHNYFDNCNSRLPLFRHGNGHFFNNYYSGIASTGINSRMGACLRVENNYFKDAQNPIVSAYSDELGGVDQSGNTFDNVTWDLSRDDVSEPYNCNATIPYSYSASLNSTSSVPSIVVANAGVGKLSSSSAARLAVDNERAKELEAQLAIFPNPVQNRINIKLPVYTGEERIRVVDLAGVEVLSAPLQAQENTIDISSLQAGNYIIQVKTEGHTYLRMIIKE
ncbi:T9SS type A sorting domain-containing protein [Fulvivirga maritima]|uniref:InlB B-repeat-containing protein n=1 Tax=Fulvivirga maritima TaxID=2904247 RepID=UPI001F2902B3|nr:T9SS type A sorting domain-containing protein [Fulvivirga maritima]UII27141.1 T9SS type A sorting domain-containing protein [Fulvivirga maritima]